ncbi:MAG: hypothetical protein BM555_01225 [Crocinitomix sp. MedPE-SWsnd]|jgi:hypothetical protein|nr:MAG: hypothetical protein BM555_01225 [Crocinitomix sp. MedPE-SWsnd]
MKKLIYSTLAIALLAMTSCKKEEVIPPPTPTSNLSSYFSDNESNAIQTFTMDASIAMNMTGNNGVKIYVPANSFVYSNGTQVTGTVTVELIEVLDVSAMVKMNKTTTSNGELLVSGGQIKISASQNSSEIYLAPSAAINVSVPTAVADPQMALFTGNQMSDGDVVWTSSLQDSSQQDSIIITQDTTGGGGWSTYYNFDFDNDSLGWINCDYWWNSGQSLTSVTASLDTAYNTSNTACYLVFPNINSVAALYGTNVSGTFSASGIPVNTSATFVCISEIDDVYYSSFVTNTISTNHVENITMTETTLAAIETAIDNL